MRPTISVSDFKERGGRLGITERIHATHLERMPHGAKDARHEFPRIRHAFLQACINQLAFVFRFRPKALVLEGRTRGA